MMFFWIPFLIIIGAIPFLLLLGYIKVGQTNSTSEDPIRVLKMRYAKGEIGQKEYTDRLRDLEKQDRSANND